MNEIEKLQAEHARYRKALVQIQNEYVETSDAHTYAREALNPPPPPPVTLDELKAALNYYRNWSDLHSINFYSDESGSIRDGSYRRVFSFRTLREAVDFLTREN